MRFTLTKALLLIFCVVSTVRFAKAQVKDVVIDIDLSKTYQTIDNFGASDAWECQFVGNWPDAKRNQIADLLFSRDIDKDGSPKGIGLTLWRFNIGAGSTQQGNASGIRDEWRRAESFLNTEGTYNWQNQAGQMWFLKAAKKRGVKQFLGFSNSPPVQFTTNGKAYATGGKTNIAADKYDDFGTYLANVVKGVEQVSNIKFDYISPVNEPQWDWSDGGQEGCPYTNTEIAGLVRSISKTFVSNKISSKIIIGESGQIDYLYAKSNKPAKGNQVKDFFSPGGANYIGGLPNVSNTITSHSYFTTSPIQEAVRRRKDLANTISTIKGLNFWQSEYCILGDNSGEINGSKRDLGMTSALYMASVIHTDLTVANASAWQWWTAISVSDYKDGLIYIDKNKTDGNYYPAKMLWALGNYSRFIKPGALRVDARVQSSAENKSVLVSAFKNGVNLTVVIINPNAEDVKFRLNTNAAKVKFDKVYITSADKDLKAGNISGDDATITARSVTTFTGIIK
ncbi:xylanase [Mucilaginibacter corticis]|uniref:Xylanase n=1 Tax=Mucilaginibacter corticis TaxID=2597670 RepID=A0A556MUA6_9SPHI|nr:glycoside hydrolase [Mucilaginibacter corticis]TSJ43399.1 xylanase [Mucilaginibacter corticis]